jgi:hypothetical protein
VFSSLDFAKVNEGSICGTGIGSKRQNRVVPLLKGNDKTDGGKLKRFGIDRNGGFFQCT